MQDIEIELEDNALEWAETQANLRGIPVGSLIGMWVSEAMHETPFALDTSAAASGSTSLKLPLNQSSP
jgi:hypothetical protein